MFSISNPIFFILIFVCEEHNTKNAPQKQITQKQQKQQKHGKGGAQDDL